jgi:hypothetical protein
MVTERVEESEADRSEVGSSVVGSNVREETFAQVKFEKMYKTSHISQNDKNYFLSE